MTDDAPARASHHLGDGAVAVKDVGNLGNFNVRDVPRLG